VVNKQGDRDGGDGGMGVQEYRACLHLRLLFTLLMISMLDSINISVAQSWNFALTNRPPPDRQQDGTQPR
jgi:hypothetical protein